MFVRETNIYMPDSYLDLLLLDRFDNDIDVRTFAHLTICYNLLLEELTGILNAYEHRVFCIYF